MLELYEVVPFYLILLSFLDTIFFVTIVEVNL